MTWLAWALAGIGWALAVLLFLSLGHWARKHDREQGHAEMWKRGALAYRKMYRMEVRKRASPASDIVLDDPFTDT